MLSLKVKSPLTAASWSPVCPLEVGHLIDIEIIYTCTQMCVHVTRVCIYVHAHAYKHAHMPINHTVLHEHDLFQLNLPFLFNYYFDVSFWNCTRWFLLPSPHMPTSPYTHTDTWCLAIVPHLSTLWPPLSTTCTCGTCSAAHVGLPHNQEFITYM